MRLCSNISIRLANNDGYRYYVTWPWHWTYHHIVTESHLLRLRCGTKYDAPELVRASGDVMVCCRTAAPAPLVQPVGDNLSMWEHQSPDVQLQCRLQGHGGRPHVRHGGGRDGPETRGVRIQVIRVSMLQFISVTRCILLQNIKNQIHFITWLLIKTLW